MADISRRAKEEDLLAELMAGTAAETGDAFFRALVKHLSRALGTSGAWVTEYLPATNTLRALAFWYVDGYIEDYRYPIAGTPCAQTIEGRTYVHIPENVVALFPDDPDLRRLNAVSYLGFPLLDTQNNVLGNLAVLDHRPMPASFRNMAIFRIFAARVTAELLRMRAEAERRAHAEKLNGLFRGAMDAIIELDADLRIAVLNPAARRLLDLQASTAVGRTFSEWLDAGDDKRFRQLAEQLQHHGGSRQSVWIPGGLRLHPPRHAPVATEATLTRFELHGDAHFALILRDINERDASRRLIAALRNETSYLRDEIEALFNLKEIIGRSPVFRETMQLVSDVAPTDATVILYGETGTGKELLARAIHAAGRRKDRPMITVNCAAIPATLIESEFFGHESGAFTGATRRREGRFALADGGTIFLDEVGELNLEMQAKLLRVLQEGEFSPVGSSRTRQVNTRVIAATNRDLSRAVQEGRFRPDLYFRLNVFPITVPPLRRRGGDIELLATHLTRKIAGRMGRAIDPLTPDLIGRLKAYHWPGNIRELQNVIERGVITARHGRLNLDHALPAEAAARSARQAGAAEARTGVVRTVREFRQMERDNLLLAMQTAGWRIAGKQGAARLLGVAPSTLQSRLKALDIRRPDEETGHALRTPALTNIRLPRSRDFGGREMPRP